MTQEQWLPIPGFPGYDVSDHGRVRSYRARGGSGNGTAWRMAESPQRILRPSENPDGYRGVNLMAENGQRTYHGIARLVLATFVGPRPEGLESCHNDGTPANNHLDNLRYDTHQGNLADIPREDRSMARGSLTEQEVLDIRQARANGANGKVLGRQYGMSTANIYAICSGRTYTHIGGPQTRKKIPKSTIKEILARLKHQSARSLAREYGIHESTISRWRNGSRRKAIIEAIDAELDRRRDITAEAAP